MLRYTRHDPLDQVAVWIDEHQPFAGFDIGEDEPLEQRRFSGARLPDDVHVRKPIGLLDAENPPVIAGISPGKVRERWVAIHPPIFQRGERLP